MENANSVRGGTKQAEQIENKFEEDKFCYWCGKPLKTLKSPNQRYCDPEDTDCQKLAYNEKARLRMVNYRKRWKAYNLNNRPGTTTLGLNIATDKEGNPDFEKEMRIINREHRRYLSRTKNYITNKGAALFAFNWTALDEFLVIDAPAIAGLLLIGIGLFLIFNQDFILDYLSN
jgi:hypothetical protein